MANARSFIARTVTGVLTLTMLVGCTHGDGGAQAPVETAAPAQTVAETPDDAPHGTGQTLRVGIRFDQPGLGLMSDGDPTGFDVDVAAYVAYKLGYSPFDIEWVEVRPADREEMLSTGAVDMVVAAYSITDERAQQVEFAGPYLLVGQDILVRAEETAITGPDDLSGRTLCEVTGSTSNARVRELVGVHIVEKADYSTCARALVAGEVDAVSTDDIILAGLAASDEFFALVRLVGAPFSQERYGIGLPAGSTDRCGLVNGALVEMVQDGSWQRFIDRHTAGTGYSPEDYGNPPAVEPCV